jgi:hypothetical protein
MAYSRFAARMCDAVYLMEQAEELRTLAASINTSYPDLASFLVAASTDFDAYAHQAHHVTIARRTAYNLVQHAFRLERSAGRLDESYALLDRTATPDPR